ncbi:AI-2E family transporter [Beggiatoa alba]|nr:AI-2E family transporter [Beggiatoa alba]
MTDSAKWLVLAGFIVFCSLVYLLAPILTPFVIAAVLSYIGDPFVDWLELKKMPRSFAVTMVFVVLTLAASLFLLILIPLVEKQILVLINKVPEFSEWIQNSILPAINEKLGEAKISLDLETLQESLKSNWQSAGGIVAQLVTSITRSGVALFTGIANLALIYIVSFYLLRDWDLLIKNIHHLLPRNKEKIISSLAKQSDEVLGAFFRGQLLVVLVLIIVYCIGLSIIGLDLAILIGLLAGVVSFVPYLGLIIGIVVAGIAAIMQFHDVSYLLYVVIVFGVGQVLEGMLLTPLLVGDKIGLHPVAVIFAILAGGQLFGFFGILCALPVAAVLAVVIRHIHLQYKESALYNTG